MWRLPIFRVVSSRGEGKDCKAKMNSTYDCMVIGTGGVGSAACWHLARRGARVLGLDRFPLGHDRGSSHGATRVIRQAYYEHPDYVPLLLRAYALWRELEAQSGEAILLETGLIQCVPADGTVQRGVREAARLHGLPIDQLSAVEVMQRWPGFAVPEHMIGLYEARAGILQVEACVRAHGQLAMQHGAELHQDEIVQDWSCQDDDVTVTTNRGRYTASCLVITAGAWAADFLATLGVPLHVLRKVMLWYRPCGPQYAQTTGTPCFLFETPAGLFYGFPQLNELGVKVAQHSGGEPVSDPLCVDRRLRASDRQPIEHFLQQHLPQVSAECLQHAVCLYTMSPDEQFVIGQHPDHPQICVAAGLSGHGFKFTSVLGEIMADLALDGRTAHPIAFLSPERFQVRQ